MNGRGIKNPCMVDGSIVGFTTIVPFGFTKNYRSIFPE
jgi:hypothetical protein